MSNLDMIFLLIILALGVVRHSTPNEDVAQSEHLVYQSCDTKMGALRLSGILLLAKLAHGKF